MPYRNAHWWLLSLFPLIAVAFWPGYWGHLSTAPFALHAHGITATAWLVLLTAQSWAITLFAATAPEAVPGGYYGPRNLGETRGAPGPARIPPQALDQEAAKRLWEVSESLTGVSFSAG